METIFNRTIKLIGEEKFKILQNKTVLLFGLGGVGGTAFESLLRSGISNFVLVDFDKVDPSNLNRQVLFSSSDIGKVKVEAAKEFALKINPKANIEIINCKVNEDFFKNHSFNNVDYIVDAIDDCDGKLAIAKFAFESNIKLVMSLGMANRLDPSKVITTKLSKTEKDPLARKIRSLFRKNGLDISKIDVVVSTEDPIKNEGVLSSLMMVPSSAGLSIAFNIIKDIIF